jgi:hypothetical protein
MDEEFAHSSVPGVTIIEAGEKARKEYGHKWGSQCLSFNAEQIHALTAYCGGQRPLVRS